MTRFPFALLLLLVPVTASADALSELDATYRAGLAEHPELFTAVANAKFIQAISEERDDALAKVAINADLVKALPHLVDGEGEGLLTVLCGSDIQLFRFLH